MHTYIPSYIESEKKVSSKNVLECFLFSGNLFFFFYVAWYAGMHKSTTFITVHMCNHWRNFLWDAISYIMTGKYSRLLSTFSNKRLYEYYPKRLARFVDLLTNPSE